MWLTATSEDENWWRTIGTTSPACGRGGWGVGGAAVSAFSMV